MYFDEMLILLIFQSHFTHNRLAKRILVLPKARELHRVGYSGALLHKCSKKKKKVKCHLASRSSKTKMGVYQNHMILK